jgi:2-polyprenyl-3-methyl-5-hydroxy-6-metoxy-1,4-benzoquinol methylase
MDYDQRGSIPHERFSAAWFDAIDARFQDAARLFATRMRPFDRILPLDALAGVQALEVGCGMGLHCETMVRAGAKVTAVDISPVAIEATRRRLSLRGLSAEILAADAERLPFPDRRFDFVWSWGVIHHSTRTAKIVREMARVLRPEGECRVMVYRLTGTSAVVTLIREHLLGGGFLRRSFDETLSRSSDGSSARFYVRDQIEDMFRAFFKDVSSEVCGLESDAIPLPPRLRALARKIVPERTLSRLQARGGSFLFLNAKGPF